MSSSPPRTRRNAAQTRADIRRVAMELFTEKGFDATSTRDIAAELGINQSSLYYHFKSKDDIVISLQESRLREVETYLEWLRAQPRSPDLLRIAALRWIECTTEEHVHAQRMALTSQAAHRRLASGRSIPAAFEEVIAVFVDESTPAAEELYIRAVFNSVTSVLAATFGKQAAPADIIAAARRMVTALTSGTER